MKKVRHPAAYLSPNVIVDVRQYAKDAEHLQELHPSQVCSIYKYNWFNCFVPAQFNGMGLSLPKALHVEEALAYADGSVGWTVTLCAGAAWFIGFLDPAVKQLIFSDKNVCIAGSGKVGGIAHKTSDGFLVNGKWDYATGAPFATAFTANCILYEQGKPLTDKAGKPIMQSFLFLKEEVTICKNWNKIGMVATGSHGFSVKNLLIPSNRAFIINRRFAHLPQPIYQYPFFALAQITLAVNSSGMAMRFLDICTSNVGIDKYLPIQKKLPNAYAKLEKQRQTFYKEVALSWAQCKAQKLSSKTFKKVGKLSKELAHQSLRIVDSLFPLCGMEAANPATEINRVWRNMHTASQHSIFNK